MANAPADTSKKTKKAARRKKPKKIKLEDMPGLAEADAPIDGGQLLRAAQPLLQLLEADLKARAMADPGVTRALKARHQQEKAAERTADKFDAWQQRIVTQVAASWLLSCVFVRILEDRGLLGQNRIAGPGALDSQKLFFELAPSLTERDYLLTVFRELSRIPAANDLFDAKHSLLWKLSPSAEATKELLALFRTPSSETPAFRFGQESTRFLGDLYQDLSEDVRKRYALLQTPDFIESFILDRTLEPAIERFGLEDTTLIDPTCGSGHFLLGAFDRLFEHRLRHEPGIDRRQAAHKAIDAVYGADINPYAVAIARFRLTLSYVNKCEFVSIADAPMLPLHLVVADSLLHNPHQAQLGFEHQDSASVIDWRKLKSHGAGVFALEDETAARNVLHRQYAAVVGNPPYITVKDAARRDAYRKLYSTCYRNYSLAAPFCERFFQLGRDRGYVGQITANSFMKREFGKKLIQDYLPSINLQLIVNSSGAYIPGHGTPTVLLFGTHEEPQSREVLSVLAKRGEPSTPADPARGEVWSSIAKHWSQRGFENEYMSVRNTPRDKLGQHPWSLAGGGAMELKTLLESRAGSRLGDIVAGIGRTTVAGEDDLWIADPGTWRRFGLGEATVPLVIGESVRDWAISGNPEILYPYDSIGGEPVSERHSLVQTLWPWRTLLGNRTVFGKQMRASGRKWWEHLEHYANKLKTPLSITFAFVATHNHFVLDRGGKVFKQSAPIIKLPADATEDDHLALLAYLNSSTACFWMKQVFHKKSSASQKHHTDPARAAYEFAGTALKALPVPSLSSELVRLAKLISAQAQKRSEWLSGRPFCEALDAGQVSLGSPSEFLVAGWSAFDEATKQAAYWQEELDWHVYSLLGLAPETASPAPQHYPDLGSRPFERADGYSAGLSDRIASIQAPTVSAAQVPPHWLAREAQIGGNLARLEQREYKRMWRDTERNVDQNAFRRQLRRTWAKHWMLAIVEKQMCGATAPVPTVPMRLGEMKVGKSQHDQVEQLAEAVKHAAVPYLAALTFSESGMSTQYLWRAAWEQQRLEDAGSLGPPSGAPSSYGSKDYRSTVFWQLRGKLDVPKERFISYPGCESDEDGEPVYGWAGWDHLQRAQALASLYQKRKTEEGWGKERLTPMLAGLLELIPWIKQWHNEPSDEFGGLRMGEYYADFLDGECRTWGLSRDELEAWRPPKKGRGGRKKKAAAKKAKAAAERSE